MRKSLPVITAADLSHITVGHLYFFVKQGGFYIVVHDYTCGISSLDIKLTFFTRYNIESHRRALTESYYSLLVRSEEQDLLPETFIYLDSFFFIPTL